MKQLVRKMGIAYVLIGGWVFMSMPVTLSARVCPPGTRCSGFDFSCADSCTTDFDACCLGGHCLQHPNICDIIAEECMRACCLNCIPI